MTRRLPVGVLMAALAIGCGRATDEPSRAQDRLVVFAASSLREAFEAVAERLRAAHPSLEVTFNFAASQELRTQIEHGAHADVFASADLEHAAELRRSGRVEPPRTFARNELVIAVARENAASIRSLEDLPFARRIVVGVADAPIGRYTLQILDNAQRSLGPDFRARVEARVVSREMNTRQVLAKVSLGEADAGIVYWTDAAAAGDRVTLVAIPPEVNVIAELSIAVVSGTPCPDLARAWVDLVLSSAGQQILTANGFLPARGKGDHR